MAAQILIVGRVADRDIKRPGAQETRSSTTRVVTGIYRRLPALATIGLRLSVSSVWLGDPESKRAIAALARQGVSSLPALLGFGQPIVGAAAIVDFCDQLLERHSPDHGPSNPAPIDPDRMLENFYNSEMLNADGGEEEDSGMNDGDGKFDASLRQMEDRRGIRGGGDPPGGAVRGGGDEGLGNSHTMRESNVGGYAPCSQFSDDDMFDGGGGGGDNDEAMLMAKILGAD